MPTSHSVKKPRIKSSQVNEPQLGLIFCVNIVLMIIAYIFVVGLCLGSFVNALVWRVHEQSKSKKKRVASDSQLSLSKGRSMCPECQHLLNWTDLIPVVSWLSLKGRCRYCHKPIAVQYPIVELSTALLFVLSYIYWPQSLIGLEVMIFSLWLLILTGLMALIVYDARWMLLPNRIVFPLTGLGAVLAILRLIKSDNLVIELMNLVGAVLIGGGIFYMLYQGSKGKWIGGGDVKLGWLLGLLVATPTGSFMVIFIAATLGTIVALPGLFLKRLKASSEIPFGPFLIVATIIVLLFSAQIIDWYNKILYPM